MASDPALYPVTLAVDLDTGQRNRLTTGFRFILAIPHMFLSGFVGSMGNVSVNLSRSHGLPEISASLLYAGVLGAAAGVCAVISWFAILFTGSHPQGLWDFEAFVLRWQVRTSAYVTLFRDEYPPFGDADYPAAVMLERPEGPRNRLSVGLRFIFIIPHAIVLAILDIGWFFTTVVAWFAILFTGVYPASLADFGKGVFRWQTRVAAYMLLLRDEYPPFSLNA
ncbi:MAG: DUF4389 domain-containing protein [Dehalococcoidia bacterium]